MTDGMEQARTGVSPVGGGNETEIVAPIVDYPSGPLAWSAEHPMRPAARMGKEPIWPRVLHWLKYLVPAAMVVAVAVIVLAGRSQPQTISAPVAPPPRTAPPQTWAPVVPWTPTQAKDDQYIQAMINSGWNVGDRQQSLNNAHFSCTYLSQGHTKQELVNYWDQIMWSNDVTKLQNHDDDEVWVGIITNNMCPQYN